VSDYETASQQTQLPSPDIRYPDPAPTGISTERSKLYLGIHFMPLDEYGISSVVPGLDGLYPVLLRTGDERSCFGQQERDRCAGLIRKSDTK
jgi:hypothetical protein